MRLSSQSLRLRNSFCSSSSVYFRLVKAGSLLTFSMNTLPLVDVMAGALVELVFEVALVVCMVLVMVSMVCPKLG